MVYSIHTAPTVEPLTLTEAKSHLAVSTTAEDDLISALITTAREMVENYTARQLCAATWELYADCFPSGDLLLDKSPVTSITSVKYYNTDGELTTLSSDDYVVDVKSYPARISMKSGSFWPSTYDRLNAVVVEFESGYGAAADVPRAIKSAMLLIIGHLFENRGDEGHRTIPQTVWDILHFYQVRRF